MKIWNTTKTGRSVKGSQMTRDISNPYCIAHRRDDVIVFSVGTYMVELTLTDIEHLKKLRPAYYE